MGAVGRVVRRCVLGAAVMLSLLGSAAPAHAVQVSCGDTISSDTKVSNDLTNCTGDGLVIDQGDVTLDLNGHTVDGDDSGNGDGIVIQENLDNVIVKNGKVRQFEDGAFVGKEGSAHRLLNLRLVGNRAIGLHFEGATTNSLVRSVGSVDNDGDGISVFLSTGIVLDGATATGNGGRGFTLAAIDESLVQKSRADNNGDDGLFLDANSNGDLVRDFVSEANDDTGLFVSGTEHTLLRLRSLNNDGEGITLFAARFKLLDSVLSKNAGDGVFLFAGAEQGLLSGNTANHNDEDGLDIDEPQTTLRRNTANDNGGFGIDAVSGVTDLGGNRAKGNGGQNCVNVNC
jgi:parallel beta-helix repeat protein